MNRQRGISMVELMISMTLGLLVVAAATSIFLASRSAYLSTTGISGQADNGRFANDFLTRAIRSSGFIGCNETPRVTLNVTTAPSVLFDFTNALSGFEAKTTAPGSTLSLSASPAASANVTDWTGDGASSLPANFTVVSSDGSSTTAGLKSLAVAGSDILVVHGTLQQSPVTVSAISNGADNFSVNLAKQVDNASGSTEYALEKGQVAAISDCAKATVFQITDVTGTKVTHALNTAMSFGNTQSAFAINYEIGAQLYLPTTTLFYIGVGADGNSALFQGDLRLLAGGNGLYALYVNEVASDVENMQVLYGVDATGIHNASQYVTADNVAATCTDGSSNCVVSVQVALLVASADNVVSKPAAAITYDLLGTKVTPPIDRRRRTVFLVNLALRNALL